MTSVSGNRLTDQTPNRSRPTIPLHVCPDISVESRTVIKSMDVKSSTYIEQNCEIVENLPLANDVGFPVNECRLSYAKNHHHTLFVSHCLCPIFGFS